MILGKCNVQATFLKAKAPTAQNSSLLEELQQLDSDALALRCRRNGLSREGGKETQMQRLINLQAYLSGDTEAEPVPKQTPAQEISPAVGPLYPCCACPSQDAKYYQASRSWI